MRLNSSFIVQFYLFMRKLVAGLTVRNNSQRLYAKPLQNISKGVSNFRSNNKYNQMF